MRFLICILTVLFFSCSQEEQNGPGPGGFATPVITANVKQQTIQQKVPLVASLWANEVVEIVAEIDSKLTEIGFEEGTWIEQGQVLFRLEDTKLKAELDAAEAEFMLTQLSFERAKKLLIDRTINQQNYDEAEAQFLARRARMEEVKENLEDAIITAPFSGYVSERLVSLGQFVTRGTKLTTLVDNNPIKAEFFVPERYSTQLSINQNIFFRTIAFGDRVFEGRVSFISPVLRMSDRTIQVKAMVPNPNNELKPGMFGNLDLIVKTLENAMVIPESAISFSPQGTTVYVVNAENKAEIRPVEIGIRETGIAQILNGIDPDDIVIVEGTQKVFPGSEVMAKPMNGQE